MMRLFPAAVLMGIMLVLTACTKPTPPEAAQPGEAQTGAAEEPHTHGSGPHGGAITHWGDGEYHVEFTVDHDTQTATVYILDSNAEKAAPVKADKLTLKINEPAFVVELLPQPMEGEAEGTSSRFTGKKEELGVVQEFAGTISGQVDGKEFSGDFAEIAETEPATP